MKAISLWQPWATLIAYGVKTIETRSWGTNYRGPILIHAAKKLCYDVDEQLILAIENAGLKYEALPRGAFVCRATLFDCRPMDGADGDAADWVTALPALELRCGNYGPGRWGWMLKDIERFNPIPAVGRQGLWEPKT